MNFKILLIGYFTPLIVNYLLLFYRYKKNYFADYSFNENGIFLIKKNRDIRGDIIGALIPVINLILIFLTIAFDFIEFNPKRYLEYRKIEVMKEYIGTLNIEKHSFLTKQQETYKKNLIILLEKKVSFLDNKRLYNFLTQEEKHYFYYKVLNDLFRLSKVNLYKIEDKLKAHNLIEKANEKLTFILENKEKELLEQHEKENLFKERSKKPYLKIISKKEFEQMDNLKDKIRKLKDSYPSTFDSNYLYNVIFDDISELKSKVLFVNFTKEEYVDKISSIKNKITIFKKELKSNKEAQDEIALKKIFSKY